MSWTDEDWMPSSVLGAASAYVDTSYDQPRTEQSVVGDIVAQRQDTGTSGNDAWSGFFQKAAGQLMEYAVKKDAAETGAKLQAANRLAATPNFNASAQIGRGGFTVSPMLLIVLGVAAVVVLKS